MTATSTRQLKLGAILEGVDTDQNGWRDPDLPGEGLPVPENRWSGSAVPWRAAASG
jgi:hypothetical protein